MKAHLACALACFTATAFAGNPVKESDLPPRSDDRWRFLLAMPGWMPGLEGDVGINGLTSHVDLDPGDLIRHYDFALSLRAEASKGRFGIMGDVLYTSLSDGIGTNTIVKKLDLQVDQTIAEFALRWRVIEGPRGFLDLVGGVRYVNLFQQVVTQPNDVRIADAVERFADEFGARVRARIDEALSDERLRNALSAAVRERLTGAAGRWTGPNPPEVTLPSGPLAGPSFGRLGRLIDTFVQRKARELINAAAEEARAAARAELAAIRATTAATRATAQARARELRARVSRRIANGRAELEKEIQKRLHDRLDARVARTDDWWDPFIGLRARYNFNDRFYTIVRGDIGGFGVGSDLSWQVEGALGFQLTKHIFAEAGYRALGMDYESGGLTYDVIMQGAQVTVGIEF